MNRQSLSVVVTIVLAACSTTAAPRTSARRPVDDVAIGARIDALFTDLHRRGLFEGAVSIARNGRILYERGFGLANAEMNIPFTPDTATDGASIAKTFTAALVLDLVDKGLLELDAPVQRWLPELPYPKITLRHLLSHTSALPVGDYDFFDAHLPKEQVRDIETLLRVVAEQRPPLEHEPGARFQYSSFGYDLAALAAARAANQPLAKLLADQYFGPLGLTSAFLRPARFVDFPGVRTVGYRLVPNSDGTVRREPNEVFDLEAFHGGSNIYLSVRDLLRWTIAFFERDGLVLQPASIAKARSALTLGSWYFGRDPSAGRFWYPGHLQGFHMVSFRDVPRKVAIVYASNATLAPWLHHAIVRSTNAIVDGATPHPLSRPMLDELGDGAALLGTWRLTDGTTIGIEGERGARHFRLEGATYPMVKMDPRLYYVPGTDHLLGIAGRRLYVSSNAVVEWGKSTRR